MGDRVCGVDLFLLGDLWEKCGVLDLYFLGVLGLFCQGVDG